MRSRLYGQGCLLIYTDEEKPLCLSGFHDPMSRAESPDQVLQAGRYFFATLQAALAFISIQHELQRYGIASQVLNSLKSHIRRTRSDVATLFDYVQSHLWEATNKETFSIKPAVEELLILEDSVLQTSM